MRQKLAFVDHSFHQKFKSSQFFKDLLATRYDVVEFWDRKWERGKEVNYKKIKKGNFTVIIFWQILLPANVLQELFPAKIVWVPMYDTEIKKRPSLRDYAPYLDLNLKVICFSKTLYQKMKRAGFESSYYKYQPRPLQKSVFARTKNVFFWQRTESVTWNTIKKLFYSRDIDQMTLKLTPDPGHRPQYPSFIDRLLFSITTINSWLEKDEYKKLLRQSNIFISPRSTEGIGLAFLEALSLGMVVVAPDQPTMNEYVIHNKTGYLFDPKKPERIDLTNLEAIAKASFLEAKRNFRAWERNKSKIFKSIAQPSKMPKSKHSLLFSVVTPSFNQAQFIRQSIDSVFSQKGNFSIDYLIADGGSTDGTVAIIKEYQKKLKANLIPLKCNGITFRWWSRPDSGQANAINQAFKVAKGTILAWINSDDYYEPGAFARIAKIFELHPNADLVYGNCREINTKLNRIRILPALETSFEQMIRFGGNAVPQPSAFFSQKIMKRVDYLDESLHFSLDYELFVKIAMHNGKLIPVSGKPLATFRIWENSKTGGRVQSFVGERRIVRKRYGGSLIDIKEVFKLTGRSKFLKYLHDNHPTVFALGKRLFFAAFDRLNFRIKSTGRG